MVPSTAEKVSEAGVSEATGAGGGAVPAPLSATICGDPAALSATKRVAVKLAAEAGLKVTDIEQLAPAASVLPHVLVSLNSLGFAPAIVIPVMVSDAFPVFDSEMLGADAVAPTTVFGKATIVGFSDACGVLEAETVKVSALEVPPPGAGFVTVTDGDPTSATSLARIDAVSFVALT